MLLGRLNYLYLKYNKFYIRVLFFDRNKQTTTPEPEPEERNTRPMLRNRLPKTPVTAGKAFKIIVPEENFYDAEDGTNLNLELLDKNYHVLKGDSWIQFNSKTREIYGL